MQRINLQNFTANRAKELFLQHAGEHSNPNTALNHVLEKILTACIYGRAFIDLTHELSPETQAALIPMGYKVTSPQFENDEYGLRIFHRIFIF